MAMNAVSPAGGATPHENRQPYLALRFCICEEGEYPVPG
jgi:microcystin-dependent protein